MPEESLLCTWNIRGFNESLKHTEVKNGVKKMNIKVMVLCETRVKAHKFDAITRKFGRHWKWIANYEHCSRGRLWIGITMKLI